MQHSFYHNIQIRVPANKLVLVKYVRGAGVSVFDLQLGLKRYKQEL